MIRSGCVGVADKTVCKDPRIWQLERRKCLLTPRDDLRMIQD